MARVALRPLPCFSGRPCCFSYFWGASCVHLSRRLSKWRQWRLARDYLRQRLAPKETDYSPLLANFALTSGQFFARSSRALPARQTPLTSAPKLPTGRLMIRASSQHNAPAEWAQQLVFERRPLAHWEPKSVVRRKWGVEKVQRRLKSRSNNGRTTITFHNHQVGTLQKSAGNCLSHAPTIRSACTERAGLLARPLPYCRLSVPT